MKAKVLIVDDDQDIVTMLQDRLDAGGYKRSPPATASVGLNSSSRSHPTWFCWICTCRASKAWTS